MNSTRIIPVLSTQHPIPRKILIIRFSSIGDIVLTTPVIRCLKTQLNAEVHYLTKQSFLSILKYNPHIDKIFTIQKKVSEVLRELKKEKYDVIIDLHKNLRTWQVRIGLGFPKTLTFDKINFEKWLMVNFKINRLPKVHIVDRYLKSVESLGVKNDGEGLDYFLPPEESTKTEGNYIAFAIGAAHATKRLPREKVLEFCQKINTRIVLLGGKDVAEEGAEIAKQAGTHVQNLCGEISLHASARYLCDAQKVITHDTGMMHIAAAFNKEIISIWGNTIPEFGMYPYYKKGEQKNKFLEVKGLSCRPCSKIGYDKCPKGHFKCMTLNG
ncbi:MAG: ADP-heptose:LPS heptosyltransferase [Paraglaciecola sp.]|jgi:ADP-heptose:LPS heptosyltransferase